MNRRFRIAWLSFLCLSAFILFLNGPDIVTSHEARVALPARVMAASGWPWAARSVAVPAVKLQPGIVRLLPDWNAPPIEVNPWLVPVMNGQVRLQKPPLPYWCAAITFRVTGGFSEAALRVVPALLGMLAAFLMFDLGRVLYGRRIGWLAGLAWVSTYAIPEQYRKAMADPYLAFFTLMCVWSWVRAWGMSGRWAVGSAEWGRQRDGETEGRRDGKTERRPSIFLLCFYFSFALALLAKGPPAFVDILLPLVVFHCCVRGGVPGRVWVHGLGVFLMMAVALPWAVYVWRNVPHALELWRYESVGELGDNTENARPWWFYGPQLLYLALPWTALWMVGIARQIHRARDLMLGHIRRKILTSNSIRRGFSVVGSTLNDESSVNLPQTQAARNTHLPPLRTHWKHFFPLFWYCSMVIFFSFVHLKKNQYLLPALPAQTLLIAQGLAIVLAAARKTRLIGQAGALIGLQTFIGIAFGAAVLVMMFNFPHRQALDWAVAGLALTAALLAIRPIIGRRVRTWLCVQSTAYVLLGIVFIRGYLTPKESERSAKYVAAEMLSLSRQPGWTLLPGRLPEEVAVYLPVDARYDFRASHVLIIVDDQHGARYRELHHLPMPAPPVEQFSGWIGDGQLIAVRQIPLTSAPGDARWKVYELTVSRRGYAMR